MNIRNIAEVIPLAPSLVRGMVNLAQNKPVGFSFNVSDRCPINCQCYWRAQDRVNELSDKDVINFFHQKRKEGLVHATLVGGEPYVRRDLLPQLVGILPITWIVTSGTTPLLDLNATHFVSVDGPSAEVHDRVRRSSGLYKRIQKNLTDFRARSDSKVIIHTVLNKLNHESIWEMLDTWWQNRLCDGVIFSTHTPIKGAHDDDLRLNYIERDILVSTLLDAKLVYPGFLSMTTSMIEKLHPRHTETLHPGVCGTALFAPSFYANGERIPQCILSEKADCTQCGCVITTFLDDVGFNHGCIERLRLALTLSTY